MAVGKKGSFHCSVAITQTKELQYRRRLCPRAQDLDFRLYRLQYHPCVDLSLASATGSPVNKAQNSEMSRRPKFRSGKGGEVSPVLVTKQPQLS